MRYPLPSALRVDHPALPVPMPGGEGLVFEPGASRPIRSLGKRNRLRLGAQLTALAALLAEFDLWPGQGNLMRARAVDGNGGVQAVVPGFPVSLSTAYRRLGGGEHAADVIRTSVVRTLHEVVGLPLSMFDRATVEPGFYLEATLRRLLEELPAPLDAVTARNLWALRWDPTPLPEDGETSYWSAPVESVAQRLGAAVWSDLRRVSMTAWYRLVASADPDTAPFPGIGLHGTLVVAGKLREQDLAAAERWTRRPGCSAVVLGTFPRGWSPPNPPGFDGERLDGFMAVTGLPLDRCRLAVERRKGRFNPLSVADRSAMTAAARNLFADGAQAGGGDEAPRPDGPVARVLRLLPEGLPEGFVAVSCGLPEAVIRRQLAELPVVVEGNQWRLATAEPLCADPLHGEVAGLFPENDPRRLRHLFLAGGDVTPLLQWSHRRLAELRNSEVRDLLAEISPGDLGRELRLVLAQACLAELDLAGARRALDGLPADLVRTWQSWVDAVDGPSSASLPEPAESDVDRAPLAVATAVVASLRRDHARAGTRRGRLRSTVERALERLEGAVQRWIRLELAAIEHPHLMADRRWRQALVAGEPWLYRRLLHRRALALRDAGNIRQARRVLTMAAAGEPSPGWRGMLELDIGSLDLEAGRSGDGYGHNLTAHRLLQAAGFRHRTRDVLFNLAVSDLDRLLIERARQRLEEAAGGMDALSILAERARLELAVGNLERFRALVAMIREQRPHAQSLLGRKAAFLLGVDALLDGRREAAAGLLASGAHHGEAWLTVLGALDGRPSQETADHGWGLDRAARLIGGGGEGACARDLAALAAAQGLGISDALAVALACTLRGARAWLPRDLVLAAARALHAGGLDGWSASLQPVVEAEGEDGLSALVRLAELGGPSALGPEDLARLMAVVGLSGLEVRARDHSRVLWRFGDGTPGPAEPRGHITLIPLGSAPAAGPVWALLASLLELLVPVASAASDDEVDETGIHGVSEGAQRLRLELRQLAPSRVAVALLGETGVGKEVAARALHRLSGRRGKFIAVNVAAIPATLLEAELFGSVKGAYTGAERSRRGLVDSADGGTLFLDEIGDLDLPLQVKLLRFIESQEVRPVGADTAHTVDLRIITATHQNLEERVRSGLFRQDLYYRIASAIVEVPPLRDRRQDIPLFRRLFEREAVVRDGLAPVRWSREAETALRGYRWPGNVRELRHVVEVALVRAAGGVVTLEHLPIGGVEDLPRGSWEEAMAEFRRRLITGALQRNGGNRTAAARELGISRQTLLYHLKALTGGGDRQRR